MTSEAKPKVDTPTLLRLICRALDEKKAGDLRVLRVGEISSITDFLIVATGTSDPHLRALRVELEKVIDATGTRILGMDTGTESGWLVIDAFDVMVHVLTEENRERYAIEALWRDAEELSISEVLEGKSEAGERGKVAAGAAREGRAGEASGESVALETPVAGGEEKARSSVRAKRAAKATKKMDKPAKNAVKAKTSPRAKSAASGAKKSKPAVTKKPVATAKQRSAKKVPSLASSLLKKAAGKLASRK